jgi:hypothetical protein
MNVLMPFRPELAETLKDHSWQVDFADLTAVIVATFLRTEKMPGRSGGVPALETGRLESN